MFERAKKHPNSNAFLSMWNKSAYCTGNYSPSFLKIFLTPDTAPSTASLASSATSLAFEATFSAAPSA